MSLPMYRTELKPVWCPGCGDYAVLKAISDALADLAIPPHMIGLLSGIGCSSRIAGYVNAYGFNLLHGRAIPTAEGVKLARSEMTVLAVGGDGDLFSIGGGHVAHAVRSNIDITVICIDNFVYGLTKGQVSPTTPSGGDGNSPIDPVLDVLAYSIGARASFVAQGISTDVKLLKRLLVEAIRHRGFSFVNVITNCVTYRDREFREMKEHCIYLDGSHDTSDINAALNLAKTPVSSTPHLGVFFRGA